MAHANRSRPRFEFLAIGDVRPERPHKFQWASASIEYWNFGGVKGTILTDADLFITDQNPGYKKVGKSYQHQTVNHIVLEYVRKGDKRIHTNSIENFWSNFERGVIGIFHQVSVKHLQRYLDEFSVRFDNRRDQDIFSAVIIDLVIKDALRYKALTAKAVSVSSDEPISDEPFLGLIVAFGIGGVASSFASASSNCFLLTKAINSATVTLVTVAFKLQIVSPRKSWANGKPAGLIIR